MNLCLLCGILLPDFASGVTEKPGERETDRGIENMERKKLLVADPSAIWCQALAWELEGSFEVRVCHDGNQAWAMTESYCPDVMVVDLALPGLDGLSLLQRAAGMEHRPALLAVSPLYSVYIESAINRIGVDYAMLKPCDISALAEHITELAQGDDFCEPVCRDGTCGLLLELGIRPARKGFGYLEDLINLYRQNPGASMTKDLYPKVAKQNRTSPHGVERAVRDAIEQAWNSRNEAIWRKYFAVGRSGQICRPTNREFIARVAVREEREVKSA